MERSGCGALQRHWLSLAILFFLIAIESSPAIASTKIRLGASTNFLDRVHEDDLAPELAWRQALAHLLGRFGSSWSGSLQDAESHMSSVHQKHPDATVLRIHNDATAAQGSVLRQMDEESRIARFGGGSEADKQGAAQDSGGRRSSTGGRTHLMYCDVQAVSLITNMLHLISMLRAERINSECRTTCEKETEVHHVF